VPSRHLRTELSELSHVLWRRRVMRLNAFVLGSKAVGDSCIEGLQSLYLPVEPINCIGTVRIRPTDPCPNVLHPEILQMTNGIVQSVILKMEPLADADFRRVLMEMLVR